MKTYFFRLFHEYSKMQSSKVNSLPAEKTRSPTPEKGMCERLKHSDYNRCLYMQLQRVEMELELLGPHKFQMPQSYAQAVRQVQHMKNLLQNQICSSASISER